MKTYYTDNQTYVGATVAEMLKIEPSLAQGQGSTLAISGLAADTYKATVTSKTGNDYIVTESGGTATRTCTTAGKAGCPSGGQW